MYDVDHVVETNVNIRVGVSVRVYHVLIQIIDLHVSPFNIFIFLEFYKCPTIR